MGPRLTRIIRIDQDFQDKRGRMEEGKDGILEEWKRVEGWKRGRGWKRGKMEGWKRVEGWMWLNKEAQSRMNVLQPYQDVCCAENGNE